MKRIFRTFFRMACCFTALALPAGFALGQTAEQNKKMEESTGRAFNAWLSENGIKDGALVVMRAGEMIGRAYQGQRKSDMPVTVASLTKAITGACIAQLIDSGKLQLTDKMADVLKVELEPLGKPQDPRFNLISIADLLRNRSGLKPAVDYTQGGLGQYLAAYSRTRKNLSKQMDQVARFELAADPGSTYHYLNVNWLLLGAVVERITGEAYESYCYKAVVKPLGLPVSGLSPEWAMLSSYGGWQISAQDYAKFASQLAQSVIDRKGSVNEWLMQLSADAGGPGKSFYALGTSMRFTSKGRTIWHSGSWSAKSNGLDGFVEDSFGSYFASFDNGVTYVVNYSKAMRDKALADLDSSMAKAIRESL